MSIYILNLNSLPLYNRDLLVNMNREHGFISSLRMAKMIMRIQCWSDTDSRDQLPKVFCGFGSGMLFSFLRDVLSATNWVYRTKGIYQNLAYSFGTDNLSSFTKSSLKSLETAWNYYTHSELIKGMTCHNSAYGISEILTVSIVSSSVCSIS
jgi:hypothetical protein